MVKGSSKPRKYGVQKRRVQGKIPKPSSKFRMSGRRAQRLRLPKKRVSRLNSRQNPRNLPKQQQPFRRQRKRNRLRPKPRQKSKNPLMTNTNESNAAACI